MKKFLIYGFTLASIALAPLCTAQAQLLQATRHHYSTDDGLASNAIAHIVQDDYGYLWIATWNGLSRFDGYNFYNYKTGAGSHIPHLHNRISQLAIDNQQNVWMRMYDSRVFVVKRSSDCIVNPFESISGSEEYRTSQPITVTSSGYVLINIDGVGLYKMRIDSQGIKTQLITTGDMTISSMAEGYQDDIWLGTNQGVHRMDASNLTIERKGFFLDEDVSCLFSNGYNIFVGTKSGKVFSFSYGQEPQEYRSGGEPIRNLFVDSHGLIWLTDSRMGASRINPETKDEKFFSHNVKQPDYDGYGGAFAESNGIVWVSMNKGGFGYYNRANDEVEYFHNDPTNPWNLSNTVNAMRITSDGVVFESTVRRGLEKLEIMNKNIPRITPVANPVSALDNEVRGICYDKARKQLLLSNKSGVLYIIKDDSTRTTYTSDDNGNPMGRIYGISKDSKGNYWLSSKDNGLFKMTPTGSGYSITNMRHIDGNDNTLNDNRAYYSVEDNDGNIWVATYGGGVNLLPKGKNEFLHSKKGMKNYPINAFHKVRTVAVDKDGKVWAGTTDGVLILSYKNDKVEIDRLKESTEVPDSILMSNDIVCIDRDIHGMMWIGTNGGGIAHTIGKDSEGCWLFENFTSKNGLPSDEVKSLTFDLRGNVWFATDHNICSFDIGKRIFATYSSLEGVDETICSEGSATAMSNGNVLFGTVNGYYLVDHNKLSTSTGSTLKLHITDFWVNDVIQSPRLTNTYNYYVPDSKKVELPECNCKFAFRFASLNYQLQHRVHYQYMLEGYDSDWINADKTRLATYADVPSGTYVFKVRAFLLDSPDKYDIKEIEVEVPASFLNSMKAIWLYLVLLAVISVMFMFWMQRKSRFKEALRAANTDRGANESKRRADILFMNNVKDWMEKNYQDPALNFESLISQMSISLADFESELKRITNLSAREYVNDFRLEKAKLTLIDSDDNIAEISFRSGFPNAVQFNHLFKSKTGMTPSEYRDMARQQRAIENESDEGHFEEIIEE